MPPSTGSPGPNGAPCDDGRREAASLAAFALSLVLTLAAVLFVTVALNPNGEGFAPLAWIYAVLCLAGGAGCWLASKALSRV